MSERVDPRAAKARPEWKRDAAYQGLLRHALSRLVFLYFIPLLLLTAFFHFQHHLVLRDIEARHQRTLTEHQTAMLDIFLGDRLLNLAGLADYPSRLLEPDAGELAIWLEELKATSNAFVDLSVLDAAGCVLAYAGPLPQLEQRNYGDEAWFVRLLAGASSHVITDAHPGFRGDPHYTMALKLEPSGRARILRAVVSLEITRAHVAALELDHDEDLARGTGLLTGIASNIWLVTAAFCLMGGLVICLQARWVAAQQFTALRKEQELNRQLVHAAKLATVGELAAGIAHEVNNPLAIVAEKAGLVKDLLDPRFDRTATPEELRGHLGTIEKSVYRATSITRRLLGFVRQADVRLVERDLHGLVDELLDGLLKGKLTTGGVQLARDYDPALGAVVTDPNQLRQVLLNLLQNAVDAVAGAGTITVRTRRQGDRFLLEVADTGTGMSDDQLEQVFMPFFTTKEPGKGTGLGLSVSYGIIEGLGGHLGVRSQEGEGSVFTIELPIRR